MLMEYCLNCGSKITGDMRYCPECGIELMGNENKTVVGEYPRPYMDKNGSDQLLFRCPNCGSTLKYSSLYCEYCGSEIGHANETNSIKVFSEKISALHSRRDKSKENFLARTFGAGGSSLVEAELVSLITNYQIPNTVGDITEFMIFAASNIIPITFNEQGMNRSGARSLKEWNFMQKESTAWLSKMEQAYNKASVFFRDSTEFLKIEEIYKRTKTEVNTSRRKGEIENWAILLGAIALLVFIMIFSYFISK